MKFTWQSPDSTGRMGIRAEPQYYDAHPFPEAYLMDSVPLIADSGHLFAASLLLFGRDVSGEVEMMFPLSPAAAAAGERYLELPQTTIHPIDREAKAIPKGAVRCLALQDEEASGISPNSWGMSRWFIVREMRSDVWSGSLSTTEELRIATNGYLHRRGGGLESRLSSIAAAVIVATTMQADEIVVPHIGSRDLGLADRVADLLSNVGLGFSSLNDVGAG